MDIILNNTLEEVLLQEIEYNKKHGIYITSMEHIEKLIIVFGTNIDIEKRVQQIKNDINEYNEAIIKKKSTSVPTVRSSLLIPYTGVNPRFENIIGYALDFTTKGYVVGKRNLGI